MATTSWPTRRRSASPRVAGTTASPPRGVAERMTARSDSRSVPMTSNSASPPSANTATPPSARSTTWADVSRKPSPVTTTADPEPCIWRPPGTRPITRRLATDGSRRSATVVTTVE